MAGIDTRVPTRSFYAAALVNEIMGSGHQPQQSPAIQSRPVQAVAQSPNRLQLPSDADISPEEALERERIRREIQEKMTAMRKQMNEEKAAPSPAPPAVQSPVLTKILTPKEVGLIKLKCVCVRGWVCSVKWRCHSRCIRQYEKLT